MSLPSPAAGPISASVAASIVRHGSDDELLARHAPNLVLDRRELFQPIEVDGYVAASRLRDHSGIDLGTVDIADLDERWSAGTHLRFIDDHDRTSLPRDQIAHARRHVVTSRLGRVGLFGRLLDALFQLSVWLRPTTPRRTTAAAAAKVRRLELERRPVCYARSVRAGEWIVLHYAYFYAMNDWRTSYSGLNDHEADWEQAWVFIDPRDRSPQWVAVTSHDHRGGDLRRHWSDPELIKDEMHPRLHVGAGSHALFYRPGEYVSRIDIPALRWVLRAQSAVRGALRMSSPVTERGLGPAVGVPFIDTAGADGVTIDDWDLRSMTGVAWIESYRGLWGGDPGDPLQGERGPSGPKFDRAGEVRPSWADPLGFAGLHGTPPPSAAAARVNRDKLDKVLERVDDEIRHRARLLPLAHQTESNNEMASESTRLTELLRQRCELVDLGRRLDGSERMPASRIRDHLRHPAVPVTLSSGEGRILAVWSAMTIPIVLAAAAAALLFDAVRFEVVVAGLLLLTLPIEYLARREFANTFRLVVVEATIVAFFAFAFRLVVSAGPYALGAVLFTGAAFLLAMNAQELRSLSATRRSG